MAGGQARVDRTERLLNLVLCLLGAARPVSRAQVAASVPGYGETASDAAFERMFERDKDELRGMGIPVETVIDAGGEVLGYRIPTDEYALPPISVDAEEAAILALAASVWDEAVLRDGARTGLRKLEAVAETAPHPQIGSPRVLVRHGAADAADAAILPALTGLRRSRRVAFAYRDAQGRRSVRGVDPWAVVARDGRWYVVGHDHEREAVRAFRVDRIEGSVTVTDEAVQVTAPADLDVAALVRADHAGPGARATVQARAGAGASLRAAAVDGPPPAGEATFEVEFSTTDRLVAAACAAAPGAVIVAPVDVRRAVAERLAAIVWRHGGTS